MIVVDIGMRENVVVENIIKIMAVVDIDDGFRE
jgi:hypothetical protein